MFNVRNHIILSTRNIIMVAKGRQSITKSEILSPSRKNVNKFKSIDSCEGYHDILKIGVQIKDVMWNNHNPIYKYNEVNITKWLYGTHMVP